MGKRMGKESNSNTRMMMNGVVAKKTNRIRKMASCM